MYTDLDQQLDELLRSSIESLDASDEEYRLAVARCDAVSQFLADYWDSASAGGEVYLQGSMRLGTVTRNFTMTTRSTSTSWHGGTCQRPPSARPS